MTPSKILFCLGLSFIAGIALQSMVRIPQAVVWGFLLLAATSMAASFFKKEAAILSFCLLFLVLGISRLQIAEFAIANDQLSRLNGGAQKIVLIGHVIDEPDVRDNQQKLKVKVDAMQSVVLVTTDRYPEYRYLDTVKVTGKLKAPGTFDDFNYRDYLLKDGIYSLMDFPKIELVSNIHHDNLFTWLYARILDFKEKLRQSIADNFSPPHSLILEGIILGSNKTMTQDLRDKLNGTGLRYLTAISGVHILVVSAMLMSLLLALGFWRGQAFYVAVVFVWLYVVLTGLTPSGLRAVIMGSIFLLAQKLGRQNTSSRTIALAAAVMLAQNPLLLKYDVGFQLSFLASLGIIYGKPLLDVALLAMTKEKFRHIVDIFSVTITAQLFTLPIMIYNFSTIPLAALFTNFLIIPVFYWIMVLGFLASFAGVFSTVLGFIFAIPSWILISYFLWIMDVFYRPWLVVLIGNISWVWVAAYYLMLAIGIYIFSKKLKPKFLGY